MCGIVCYNGTEDALPIILQGLRTLEYRGYDSAGVGLMGPEGTAFQMMREVGDVERLAQSEAVRQASPATCGIGHTRWASHGRPSLMNAHPHQDCRGQIMLVHNGDIEDHLTQRRALEARGHVLRSETDTEIIAHLLEEARRDGLDPLAALRATLAKIRGTYALGVLFLDVPNRVYLAKLSGSLLVGKTVHGTLAVSDTPAILPYTREVVRLSDHDVAIMAPDGFEVVGRDRTSIARPLETLEGSADDLKKEGHAHFMRKEFFSQPECLANVLRGRLDMEHGTAILGGIAEQAQALRRAQSIILTGCGSAYYAGLMGKRFFEAWTGVPTWTVLANQLPLDTVPISPTTVVISVTQSGVTADTVEAQREAKRRGALTLGVVNAVGTTIPSENDGGVYVRVGTESGVASTKAFTAQATTLAMIALAMGRGRGLNLPEGVAITHELMSLPQNAQSAIQQSEQLVPLAAKYSRATSMYFLGTGAFVPTVLEGALKLKEIGYIHAEAYPAGELKHGPLALVEEGFPVLVLAPEGAGWSQTASVLAKLQAIGARIILLTDAEGLEAYATDMVKLPKLPMITAPILWTMVLQRFAYEVAVAKGINPDRPKHLAKTITVR